jgi:hypothetical protein
MLAWLVPEAFPGGLPSETVVTSGLVALMLPPAVVVLLTTGVRSAFRATPETIEHGSSATPGA